jgi:hypothetical protein
MDMYAVKAAIYLLQKQQKPQVHIRHKRPTGIGTFALFVHSPDYSQSKDNNQI